MTTSFGIKVWDSANTVQPSGRSIILEPRASVYAGRVKSGAFAIVGAAGWPLWWTVLKRDADGTSNYSVNQHFAPTYLQRRNLVRAKYFNGFGTFP